MNYRKFAWWNTQWAYAGVRDPAAAEARRSGGYDDGKWEFTGDTSRRLGPDEGDSRHPDDGDGADGSDAARGARGATLPTWTPLLDQVGPRALERLRHRPAAAGRPEGRGGGIPEGDARWSRATPTAGSTSRARGSRKATSTAPKPMLEQGAERRSRAGQDALLPRHGAEERSGATTRRSRHLQAAAAQYPRDRVVLNQIGRVLFLQRAVQRGGRGVQKVLGDRSGRSAGALQPDALLPGPGQTREPPRGSRRSTNGSRPTSRRRRSPGRIASSIPTTTTSGSRSTSTAARRRPTARSAAVRPR